MQLSPLATAQPQPQAPAQAPAPAPVPDAGPRSEAVRAGWGGAYWSACAVFAVLLAATTSLTPHRVWGVCAALGYTAAAISARRSGRVRSRAALTASVLGAVMVPLTLLILAGAGQPEVGVVERSDGLLLHSGSPYLAHPASVNDFDPYLPGMALLGIPRALLGGNPLGDARLWFSAVFLAGMVFAAAGPRRIPASRLAASHGRPVAARRLPGGRPAARRGRCRPAGDRPAEQVVTLARVPTRGAPPGG